MEPLGATASIIAVLQLSEKLFSYLKGVRKASTECKTLRREVESLRSLLQDLRDLSKQSDSQKHRLQSLESPDGPLAQLGDCLSDLIAKLSKHRVSGVSGRLNVRGMFMWPLREGEIKDQLTRIERLKSHITNVVGQKNLVLADSVDVCVHEIQKDVTGVRVAQLSSEQREVLKWLTSTDPSSNHNAAHKLREPTTGSWFVESPEFTSWRSEPGRFLWLHGMSGCGKTILCSTIIDAVETYQPTQPSSRLAYFYFDFQDSRKQTVTSLLESFLKQLANQGPTFSSSVQALFDRHQKRSTRPGQEELLSTLVLLLAEPAEAGQSTASGQVYLIVDAMDECTERKELSKFIRRMTLEFNVHLLATSRKEQDLESQLEGIANPAIHIRKSLIEEDIRKHVKTCLATDTDLNKWSASVQQEIEESLTGGANGMFRWVSCQLDSIRPLCTTLSVRLALTNLPKNLDSTYDRILEGIPEDHSKEARTALFCLAFSARPMTVSEVAEASVVSTDTVEIADSPEIQAFSPEKRLRADRDIARICGSLVVLAEEDDEKNGVFWGLKGCSLHKRRELKLAHYSVKEYLMSARRLNGPASSFHSSSLNGELFIGKVCLLYILSFDSSSPLPDAEDFPLLDYAATFWPYHCRKYLGAANNRALEKLIWKLMDPAQEYHFLVWLKTKDPDGAYLDGVYNSKSAGRLYYMALLGLTRTAERLLVEGADPDAEGGRFQTPLLAAIRSGHTTVVQLLVERGADITIQRWATGNSLHVAASSGHAAIVEILLGAGAEVDAPSRSDGTALEVAASSGSKAVVNILLRKRAEMNANILHAAASSGNETTVENLLDKGAEVNARQRHGNSALQGAVNSGNKATVELLLGRGAEVNAQGGSYGNALQMAAWKGHEAIAKLLLDKGADVNSGEGHCGSVLHAAACSGSWGLSKLLLDRGAEINARGGEYGSALQAAAWKGSEPIAQLLLDRGADINAQGARCGNALRAAACQGNKALVELFLERGADINAQGGRYGSALQAAATYGAEAVARLLLDKGANVNAQGGEYGNALQSAISCGKEALAKLLLDRGADVNTRGGYYGNALQAAACRGSETIAKLLLDNGAEVNARGGEYWNALHAAAANGNEAVAKLLLQKGAEINARGGEFGTALQAAAFEGQEAIAKLLLDMGAEVNIRGGYYGTALQAAAYSGHRAIVALLLDKGADANAQGGLFGTALKAAKEEGHHDIESLLIQRGATASCLPESRPPKNDESVGFPERGHRREGARTEKAEKAARRQEEGPKVKPELVCSRTEPPGKSDGVHVKDGSDENGTSDQDLAFAHSPLVRWKRRWQWLLWGLVAVVAVTYGYNFPTGR